MAERDRARKQRRQRRGRPAAPPTPSVLDLGGHAVEPVEAARPRPTWAWSQTVPLAAAPGPDAAVDTPTAAVTVGAESEPQALKSNGAPGWAWKDDAPAVAPAVVFATPLVEDEDEPAAVPAPEPGAAAPAPQAVVARRGKVARALLLAIPAVVALGVVIVLSRALPEPSGAGAEVLWWSVLAAAGLATLVLVDLGARRVRPSALGGAGLPRLGGGLGEMTVVVAIGAVLAGAGILHLPAGEGTAGTVTAVHASQPQAPAVAPPLAIAPVPQAPILPAQRTPVTGGGGVDLLPDVLFDQTVVSVPVVMHAAHRAALSLPPPLGAARGGAAADAAAVSGTLGTPDGPPVNLGPLAPASATTTPSQPSASDRSGLTACGGGDAGACPAEQLHSLSSEATAALATVERGPAPDCSPSAGSEPAPPMGSACTQGIHVEMLLTDLSKAVVADGISSSSFTSACPAAPLGRVTVGDLEIGGIHIAGGPGALVPTSTPAPNTTVALAAGTVVLNEQRPDRGAGGLTVNAVHIVAPASLLSSFSLDMVIGHSHSAASAGTRCAAAPAGAITRPAPPARIAGPSTAEGLLPDVIQVRRLLRGVISL